MQDIFEIYRQAQVVEPNYTPRPLQRAVHEDKHRDRVVVAHRRFGKSYLAAFEVVEHGMTIERDNMEFAPPKYFFIAPTRDQAMKLGYEPMQKFLGDYPFKASYSRGEITWRHPNCLLYTSPSPRDRTRSRMPSSA